MVLRFSRNLTILHTELYVEKSVRRTGYVTIGRQGSNITPGTYWVEYNYRPTEYLQDSASRGIAPLVIIFFVLGIMVVAVILLKKSGVIDGKF